MTAMGINVHIFGQTFFFHAYWYKPSINKLYRRSSTESWYEFNAVVIGEWYNTGANTSISAFNTAKPFRAVDYNEFNSTPHIVEIYRNGQSWYVLYSNGWCEQGGVLTQVAYGTIVNINLLKSYKDTNFNVNAWSRQLGYGAPSTISCNPTNANYIQVYHSNTASATMNIGWEAKGYIL